MYDFSNKTTVSQGSIGLGAAIAHFVSTGAVVLVPLNDNQSYDLVVDIDGKLNRVQVKTTGYKKNKHYTCQLKSVRPNKTANVVHHFDNTSCDILFIVVEDGRKYSIPSSVVTVKTELTLDSRFDCYEV